MEANVVICRPKFDSATAVLYEWTRGFVKDYKALYPEDSIADFAQAEATAAEVGSYLETAEASENMVYLHFDHGNYTNLLGQHGQSIVGMDTVERLSDYIVYAFACESARTLGKAAVTAGARAYLGYSEIFGFVLSKATDFKQIAISPAMKIVRGETMQAVYDHTKTMLKNLLVKCYNEYKATGSYDSYMAAIWAYKDWRSLTLHGEKQACINRNEKQASTVATTKKAYQNDDIKMLFADAFVLILMREKGYKTNNDTSFNYVLPLDEELIDYSVDKDINNAYTLWLPKILAEIFTILGKNSAYLIVRFLKEHGSNLYKPAEVNSTSADSCLAFIEKYKDVFKSALVNDSNLSGLWRVLEIYWSKEYTEDNLFSLFTLKDYIGRPLLKPIQSMVTMYKEKDITGLISYCSSHIGRLYLYRISPKEASIRIPQYLPDTIILRKQIIDFYLLKTYYTPSNQNLIIPFEDFEPYKEQQEKFSFEERMQACAKKVMPIIWKHISNYYLRFGSQLLLKFLVDRKLVNIKLSVTTDFPVLFTRYAEKLKLAVSGTKAESMYNALLICLRPDFKPEYMDILMESRFPESGNVIFSAGTGDGYYAKDDIMYLYTECSSYMFDFIYEKV